MKRENCPQWIPTMLTTGDFTMCVMRTIRCSGCMLDIIWNAVEDEYLTVIMYLLCSIPMRFSGKTSQMIHNKGNHVGGRAPCPAGPLEGRDSPQSQSRRLESAVACRSSLRGGRDRHPQS